MAAESNEELASGLAEDFAQMSGAQARFLVRLGEFERRQAFRDEGATSLESWATERFGISTPTARAYAHVAEKAWDLPHLVGALSSGDLSFDKVRALADVATPETDRELCDQAKDARCASWPRSPAREPSWPGPARLLVRLEHDGRFLRFNDDHRTLCAQLPPDSYAEIKAGSMRWSRQIPSDGETPLDQRRCDALVGIVHSSNGPGHRGHHGQPLRRGRPRPPGRPGRGRLRRGERAWPASSSTAA